MQTTLLTLENALQLIKRASEYEHRFKTKPKCFRIFQERAPKTKGRIPHMPAEWQLSLSNFQLYLHAHVPLFLHLRLPSFITEISRERK